MNKGCSYARLAGALTLATVVSACGGGGGGGSKGTSATAGGTAAKGIISGALVTGYRADGSEIGSTTTAEDGTYNLSLKGYNGPVRLVLSPPEAPAVALVTCDATTCGTAGTGDQDTDGDTVIEFGERYVLNYELSAIINVDKTSTTVSAHITPLTTLVERRAMAGGAVLQPETVAVANSFVRQMLGLDTDPALVQPVDLTTVASEEADARALRYAVLNAAFEQILAVEPAEMTVEDLVDKIAEGFAINQYSFSLFPSIESALTDVLTAVAAGNSDLNDAVILAASQTMDGLSSAATECPSEDECVVEVVIEGPVGTNLEAAKALVATARAVTLSAMESIDDVTEPYLYNDIGEVILDATTGEPVQNPDYDSNNTFAQIEKLVALNQSTGQLTEGFGEVMGVVLSQAFGVVAGETTLESDLSVAAGLLFDEDRAEDCGWYIEPDYTACVDANAASRAAFVARFSGTIVSAGGSWTVTDASYTPEPAFEGETPEAVEVDLVLTLPASLNLAATTHVIGVTGSAANTGGSLQVDQAQATIVLQESLDLASEEGGAPKLSAISLNTQASITDGTDTFSGSFGVEFARSVNHANLNPQSELNGLMPKVLSMEGLFTDSDSGNSLDVDVTLNVSNAEQFHFYDEGYERNDLTTYSYDQATNSITVVHGLPENRVEVKFTVIEDSPGTVYVVGEQISATGNAWSPGYWQVYAADGYWQEQVDTLACDEGGYSAYFTKDGVETCYVFQEGYDWSTMQYTDASVTQDIRKVFMGDLQMETLNAIFAQVPGEGVYQVGPSWEDSFYAPFDIFPADNGAVVASLDESDVDVNSGNRYATFDFNISVVGRLSDDLPTMLITATGNRTGYRTAVSEVKLVWGAETLIINYSENNGSTITVTDGVGTTMELAPGSTELEVGRIVKDGTVYGVITNENGIYLVSWLDGDTSSSQIETIN